MNYMSRMRRVFMMFRGVDYCLCLVFFLKHPHMLVSVGPLLVRIQFACGCQSYPFKADYTGHVFFSHARFLVMLCSGIPGAAVTKYHKLHGLKS